MKPVKGWQHKGRKRLYVEFRNECDFPIVCQIVRVKATDNYFIYIKEKITGVNDVLVKPSNYEVANIEESPF